MEQGNPPAPASASSDLSLKKHINFKTEETPLGSEDIKHGQKPMSSGTLALMCDEQDPMFMTSQRPKTCIIYHSNQSTSEVFAEQEKMCVDGILGLFT